MIDCLIVGGGPAGLTAAIYLARFRMTVCVMDGGLSRAAMIRKTRNHAGFPDGISGVDLLERMRRQARLYGAAIENKEVLSLGKVGCAFMAYSGDRIVQSRSVLLATGVTNRRPEMPQALHDEALARGSLRYCPICDGFEVIGRRVGVIGTGEHGRKEAEFLRSYSSTVALIAPGQGHRLAHTDRQSLQSIGVELLEGPAGDFRLDEDGISLDTGVGRRVFESIYPAMGSDIHSALAGELNARRTLEGCLKVDAHQRTSVFGVYAAGDVVKGLDQISHAMGEAGVAATAIRNDLAERRPMLHEDSLKPASLLNVYM